MLDLALSVAHHLLIFALFATLVTELALVGGEMSAALARRIASIDLWYGVLAGLIVVVGSSRVVFAAKGWFYYAHNVFFWAKMTSFLAIALLSAPPTLTYMRCKRAQSGLTAAQARRVRRFLWLEIALFAPLLVFAAAMARGYGEMVK
ncbi:MAG TPA: DUF2214 family protein [Steroidobacteraceae bacterium]|nr:DUF2214 family protein [Steroidobacteraceae bacterium]